ncbi:hypothetical protein B0H14DRAFT_2569692 [Mycena olivaceomarginata]|nr:hypothetical protein B0H14DRAFT_2569692 [Mycena olivaceomarginata]
MLPVRDDEWWGLWGSQIAGACAGDLPRGVLFDPAQGGKGMIRTRRRATRLGPAQSGDMEVERSVCARTRKMRETICDPVWRGGHTRREAWREAVCTRGRDVLLAASRALLFVSRLAHKTQRATFHRSPESVPNPMPLEEAGGRAHPLDKGRATYSDADLPRASERGREECGRNVRERQGKPDVHCGEISDALPPSATSSTPPEGVTARRSNAGGAYLSPAFVLGSHFLFPLRFPHSPASWFSPRRTCPSPYPLSLSPARCMSSLLGASGAFAGAVTSLARSRQERGGGTSGALDRSTVMVGVVGVVGLFARPRGGSVRRYEGRVDARRKDRLEVQARGRPPGILNGWAQDMKRDQGVEGRSGINLEDARLIPGKQENELSHSPLTKLFEMGPYFRLLEYERGSWAAIAKHT